MVWNRNTLFLWWVDPQEIILFFNSYMYIMSSYFLKNTEALYFWLKKSKKKNGIFSISSLFTKRIRIKMNLFRFFADLDFFSPGILNGNPVETLAIGYHYYSMMPWDRTSLLLMSSLPQRCIKFLIILSILFGKTFDFIKFFSYLPQQRWTSFFLSSQSQIFRPRGPHQWMIPVLPLWEEFQSEKEDGNFWEEKSKFKNMGMVKYIQLLGTIFTAALGKPQKNLFFSCSAGL